MSSSFQRLIASFCFALGVCATSAYAQAPAASAPAADAAAAAPAAPAAVAPAPAPAAAPAAPAAPKSAHEENPYGIQALWEQGDWVAKGTLLILIIMVTVFFMGAPS